MKIFVIVSVLFLMALPAIFAGGEKEETMMKSDDTMMKSDDAMMKTDDAMMAPDDSMMLPDEKGFYSTQGLQPRVVPFTTEAAAQSYVKKGEVVYFFAATWCPTCQATMKNLNAQVKSIPSNVTIVLVNYDTQTELKRKYGITSQHTFVQIDKNGKKITSWAGTQTVSDIVSKISTMM